MLVLLFGADVNECLEMNRCPENSYCVNTPGSYSCICEIGYVKNAQTNECEGVNSAFFKKKTQPSTLEI